MIRDIRQYRFPVLESNMFLYCRGGEALAIDPQASEEALQYLKDQGVKRVLVLLTHEHYDHTSGVVWLAERLASTVVCQRSAAEALRRGTNNRPVVLAAKSIHHSNPGEIKALMRALPQGYVYEADVVFDEELRMTWQGIEIRLVHTPGHSPGSCCVELGGEAVATGDSLIYGTPVITRFPGGNERDFLEKTMPYLRGIRTGTWILPGHGKLFRLRPADLGEDREGEP